MSRSAITDEMVERAAERWNDFSRGSQGARWRELSEPERAYWRKAARHALIAAQVAATLEQERSR